MKTLALVLMVPVLAFGADETAVPTWEKPKTTRRILQMLHVGDSKRFQEKGER